MNDSFLSSDDRNESFMTFGEPCGGRSSAELSVAAGRVEDGGRPRGVRASEVSVHT
jgi:hypothetical protein